MIKHIADLSIKNKLLLIVIFPSLLSLMAVAVFLMVLEISEFQKNTRDDLSAIATIIGNRSTAALLFHDQKLARENLAVINTLPEVRAACLYDAAGDMFAELLKDEATDTVEWNCPASVEGWTTKFTDTKLCVVQAIIDNTEKQGTVYIHADFEAAYWRKIQFVGLLFLVLMSVSILTFLLSAPLLKLISAPISKLVKAAKAISAS
ncbi:MAG: CHASE sensor domain-containing protein, partial [Methylococcales bacterium]|nr:CHASE sensor domain-containing protein [Methylococcales bacterium]